MMSVEQNCDVTKLTTLTVNHNFHFYQVSELINTAV